jgi:hypothetical protein
MSRGAGQQGQRNAGAQSGFIHAITPLCCLNYTLTVVITIKV